MAKFNIDFELMAEGLTLKGQTLITVVECDPNCVDVTAANEAAKRYKKAMKEARERYGSSRNIRKVLSIANWECYTHPLLYAIDDVHEELMKLRRNLKPCDYVVRHNVYSLTEGRPARRSYDEWEKAFLFWCFNTPIEND